MDKYEIVKEFVFDSAHRLPGKKIYGKCSSIHGHTYHMFIKLGSNTLKHGMVINFVDLKTIVNKFIIEDLDHKFLNDVPWLNKVTTCENMSKTIFDRLKIGLVKVPKSKHIKLLEVKLYETPTSCAIYRG